MAFSIMLLLTTMSVPLARAKVRRDRERELRYSLGEIRKAIDKYNDYADRRPDSAGQDRRRQVSRKPAATGGRRQAERAGGQERCDSCAAFPRIR